MKEEDLVVSICIYLLCMGAAGGCGGEGAERAEGGGVLGLPSPSGPEPLQTEPSRSANLTAAEFGRGGGRRREGGTGGGEDRRK